MVSARRALGAIAAVCLVLIGAAAGAPPPGRDSEVSSASDDDAPASVPGERIRRTINDGWRFRAGEVEGGAAQGFDDGGWTAVDLPHTWNAADAFDRRVSYRRGPSWYRKKLELEPSLRGKRIFVLFEGANQVADVHVNGERVGGHIGGYTAFAFDITDRLRFDGADVLAVRVNNSHDPDIPPLDADFTFFGGIYRDVWMIATDPVHIDVVDHASPGIFIDTPDVTADRATVRIRGTVVNDGAGTKRVDVVSRVLDATGREVATARARVNMSAGGRGTFEQRTGVIARPRLWSPTQPNLYRVVTEVRDGGRVTDVMTQPVAFRWFAFSPTAGFSLNGARTQLHGTNRHQDLPGRGNALSDAEHERDVRLVKEDGFNFLRLAHYPQDPAVLAETDRVGLMVWEEIPVVNTITQSEAFTRNAETMLVEMIRQHYNHPSVLLWGYMNEILLRIPNPRPEGYVESVADLARRLDALVKKEDPTRATVTAVSLDEVDNGSGVQDVPDIFALNVYFGWYYRDLRALGPFLDSLHARHPARPLMISEYGAGSDDRVHALESRAFDFSTEFQQRFHEQSFPQILDRPWLLGSAVWNQFDFASAGRQDTRPGLNQKGLYGHDRRPKDIAWYYRAKLLGTPVLHIATREWSVRAGSRPDDATRPITVYSNLDEVELFLDGASLGRQPTVNATARWNVTLHDGDNRLRARGVSAGSPVEDNTVVAYLDRAPFFNDVRSRAGEIAVNAGGSAQVIGDGDLVWEADRAYTPGSWGYTAGTAVETHHRIPNSDEDPLLQTTRADAGSYRFDVPDGRYEVRLRFVDFENDAAGARVFDVSVNDLAVFQNLDLAGRHGRWVTVERGVEVQAAGGKGITVTLTPRTGATTVSAILVRRL